MVHITALNKYYYGDVSKGEVVNQNLISNTASEQWLGGPALSKASHTVIQTNIRHAIDRYCTLAYGADAAVHSRTTTQRQRILDSSVAS